ncbi:hypothetical protein MNBD_ALPHA02-1430 [hydrothermal vent metagenome]|uniref:HTH cro/C1-type domain-containing protein n=1 Tax=hydrothermal vent metagenome TaxID=652676 RepID=A0A3B0S562_9ZZZZ
MRDETEKLDDWFMRAVVTHEKSLMRYLYRNWPDNPSEVGDICQEVLTRVYASARKERPMHVKAFIFSTARNLLCDMIRRAQIVRIDAVMDMESLNIQSEDVGAEEQVSARQELKYLQVALNNLPVKSRRVVELRRIHGLSQKETAQRLGISESAVESHIQRSIRKLSKALRLVSEIAASRFEAKKIIRTNEGIDT